MIMYISIIKALVVRNQGEMPECHSYWSYHVAVTMSHSVWSRDTVYQLYLAVSHRLLSPMIDPCRLSEAEAFLKPEIKVQ